jgi:hypothetical protein
MKLVRRKLDLAGQVKSHCCFVNSKDRLARCKQHHEIGASIEEISTNEAEVRTSKQEVDRQKLVDHLATAIMAFNTTKGVAASLSVKTLGRLQRPIQRSPKRQESKDRLWNPISTSRRPTTKRSSSIKPEVFLGPRVALRPRGLPRSKSGLATPRSSMVKPEVYLGPRVKQILFFQNTK